MFLTQHDVDEIRQLIADGQLARLERLDINGMTLGGALELACCMWEQERAQQPGVRRFFTALQRRFPPLAHACALLLTGHPVNHLPQEDLFSAPEFEIVPMHGDCLKGSDWQLFLHRFSRSLRQCGFGERFPIAYAGAFGEMADNVGQHSATNGEPPASGLAGFHVTREQATFAVVDTGRGILASLRDNPRWQHLGDSAAALEAVIRHRATRKAHNRFGDGFKQVFNSLVDHNGAVRLRSGDACALLGSAQAGRTFDLQFCEPASGVSVSVICALKGLPAENLLPLEKSA